MQRPRIILIGGTSLIAEHCARLWLRAPTDLVLVGRDNTRLERIAADLRLRSLQSTVQCRVADFTDPTAIAALADALAAEAPIDIVLVAHGQLPVQEDCQADLIKAAEALSVNGVSAVLFAEAFARVLSQAGQGTLAVIGSVAGDRGRQSNYVYGAAKGMVERYLQGLQHRFAGSGVKVVLIKPGPTATPMTAHLTHLALAPVEHVAAGIVSAIARGRPVVYVPAKWALIMMVIRHLPRAVFNRLRI